jgi:hypothetical protein
MKVFQLYYSVINENLYVFNNIFKKKKKREIEMVVWDNFPWLSAGLNYTSSDASALLQLWILSCQ